MVTSVLNHIVEQIRLVIVGFGDNYTAVCTIKLFITLTYNENSFYSPFCKYQNSLQLSTVKMAN